MSKRYSLSIDPGMSNGACLFSYSDTQPFQQERLYQFTGGAIGLAQWLNVEGADSGWEMGKTIDRLIVEKFTPRGGSDFNLTQASAEPLRGEGVLIGQGLHDLIDWQQPAMQYFMGGSSLSDKKKRSREFLKQHGLYATGKTVGQKDADDAISAQLHAIAWLRHKKHMPTLLEFFG